MEPSIPNLLLIPPLEATESLRAYMYKAAQANAYPRLYVGNAHALAHSFLSLMDNRDQELSEKLRWRLAPEPTTRSKASSFSLGGSQLAWSELRIKARHVCPHCLAENHWSRGEWELKTYTTCHVHGVYLVNECDQCKRKLSWDRTELLHCFCGRPLASLSPKNAQSWDRSWAVQVHHSFRTSINLAPNEPSLKRDGSPFPLQKLLEMADVIRAGYYFASRYGDGSSPVSRKCTAPDKLIKLPIRT